MNVEASPSPLLGSRGEVASRSLLGELEGDVFEQPGAVSREELSARKPQRSIGESEHLEQCPQSQERLGPICGVGLNGEAIDAHRRANLALHQRPEFGTHHGLRNREGPGLESKLEVLDDQTSRQEQVHANPREFDLRSDRVGEGALDDGENR